MKIGKPLDGGHCPSKLISLELLKLGKTLENLYVYSLCMYKNCVTGDLTLFEGLEGCWL